MSSIETLMTKGIQSWATGSHKTNAINFSFKQKQRKKVFKAKQNKKFSGCQGVNNNCPSWILKVAWGPQWWLYCSSSDLLSVISWNLLECPKTKCWIMTRDREGKKTKSDAKNIPQKIKNILNGLKDLQTWWKQIFVVLWYDLWTENLFKNICDDTCRDFG